MNEIVKSGAPHGDDLADKFNGVRGWLKESEAKELAELAKGKTVLEIGSWCGRSAIAMAATAYRVYAIDWHRGDPIIGFDETLSEFWTNIRKAGAGNVIPLVGRTQQMDILGESWADVVFVDGDHHEESVLADLELARRCLKPGGTIAMHDWDCKPVQRAFNKTFGFPTGAERQVDVTYIVENIQKKEKPMISQEDLLAEHANLEQQQTRFRILKNEAEENLGKTAGALLLTEHLLKKFSAAKIVEAVDMDEVARLKEELEQAKADLSTAKLAGEQDAKMAKILGDELKERKGVVADVTG